MLASCSVAALEKEHNASREGCLRGQAAPFGATPGARGNASALDAFAMEYPRDALYDMGATHLWDGPFFAPTEGTLDGWLLNKWYTSATSYDSIFFQNTSSSEQVRLQPPADGAQGEL